MLGARVLRRALVPRNEKRGVRESFFYLSCFMHMNAVWQSVYVCATKNCCALLTLTENFALLI